MTDAPTPTKPNYQSLNIPGVPVKDALFAIAGQPLETFQDRPIMVGGQPGFSMDSVPSTVLPGCFDQTISKITPSGDKKAVFKTHDCPPKP